MKILWTMFTCCYTAGANVIFLLQCRVLFHQHFPLRIGIPQWPWGHWRIIWTGQRVFLLWSVFPIFICCFYWPDFWTSVLMFRHWQSVCRDRQLYQKVTNSWSSPWPVLDVVLCSVEIWHISFTHYVFGNIFLPGLIRSSERHCPKRWFPALLFKL